MDTIIKDLMKNGMNINEIMDMPFAFMLDLLSEKAEKVHKVSSVMDLP